MSRHLPPIKCIIEKRYAVARRLRFYAFILLTIAFATAVYNLAMYPVIVSMSRGNSGFSAPFGPSSFWTQMMGILPLLCALAVPAGLIIGFQNRIAIWLVPLLPVTCPACGNHLQHLVQPRCPECGLQLPESLVENNNRRHPVSEDS